ncbi:MAG: hypothetical protein HOH43_06475 [Candidatus Latescibacteria bacterium]|nr:hypothetical protein [Candidatus Latescibacterota bacterium]
MSESDRSMLRRLAEQYAEISNDAEQDRRRELWRRHNSLKGSQPLIYVRAFAWKEMPQSECVCEDPSFRRIENFLRQQLFWYDMGDDSIFEPWVTVPAVHRCTGWGVPVTRLFSDPGQGSFKVDYPIKELDDIEQLRVPHHEIDEEETAEIVQRISEAVGDIITVNVDRGPSYRMWSADLSTDLGYLRGIEHFMMDMTDHPEWLHRFMNFLSSGVRKAHEEAEGLGDWGLSAHQNQAMAYSEELQDPAPNVDNTPRCELWAFMAAQEFAGVSPEMHDEFLLQYQLPILKEFGLVAYGCCEDLTHKIDMLRQIPNLRRITVSPFADVAKCAEQIGREYVLSYRPSPADMVSYDFNPERIRKILKQDLGACTKSHVDITLKDVETVQNDPHRIRNWVKIVREVTDTA